MKVLHGRMLTRRTTLAALACAALPAGARARNPAIPGWYADPEIRIFGNRYWIYPTTSADERAPADQSRFTPAQIEQRRAPGIWAPFLRQTWLDAFSSPDLVTWTRQHPSSMSPMWPGPPMPCGRTRPPALPREWDHRPGADHGCGRGTAPVALTALRRAPAPSCTARLAARWR